MTLLIVTPTWQGRTLVPRTHWLVTEAGTWWWSQVLPRWRGWGVGSPLPLEPCDPTGRSLHMYTTFSLHFSRTLQPFTPYSRKGFLFLPW